MHFYFNIFPRADFYVTSVSWASDTVLSVVFMNRPQNVSLHCLCRHPGYKCQVVSVNVKRHTFNIVKRHKIPCFMFSSTLSRVSEAGWRPLANPYLTLTSLRCCFLKR